METETRMGGVSNCAGEEGEPSAQVGLIWGPPPAQVGLIWGPLPAQVGLVWGTPPAQVGLVWGTPPAKLGLVSGTPPAKLVLVWGSLPAQVGHPTCTHPPLGRINTPAITFINFVQYEINSRVIIHL